MNRLLKSVLPYGLVRVISLYNQLRTLGQTKLMSCRKSIWPSTEYRIRRSRLNCLPDDQVKNICNVVDVGANVGDWSADVMEFLKIDRMMLIEPDPDLCQILERRFGKDARIQICKVAAGASSGVSNINLTQAPTMNSMLKPASASLENYGRAAFVREVIAVPVQTLDALTAALPSIDLLKIDVQGYEYQVLTGAKKTLQRTTLVMLEINFVEHYEGELPFSKLNDLMLSHGFSLCNLNDPYFDHGQVLWADAIYRRMIK